MAVSPTQAYSLVWLIINFCFVYIQYITILNTNTKEILHITFLDHAPNFLKSKNDEKLHFVSPCPCQKTNLPIFEAQNEMLT